MIRSEKEILDALKIIKETCKEYDNCEKCPLRGGDNDCGVTFNSSGDPHTPNEWELKNDEVPRLILG